MVALCAALLCAYAAAAAPAGDTQGIVTQGDGEITLNLREADIRAFIASVAEMTGRNFVVDPRVKGNVTVISASPTDADGLYDIFLSILKVHGFTAIPSGDVVKIMPDAVGKQEGQASGTPLLRNDALVTAVIPINNVNAAELVAVLRPLLPQEAHLAGFAASNTLVVADTSANVRRLMELVEELDTQSDVGIELIALQHADAEELVQILSAVQGPDLARSGQAPGTPFVAYPRTNTLVVRLPAAEMPRIRRLVAALDVPDQGPDDIEVITLKFASAVDLVPVLQGMLGSQGATAAPAAGKARTAGAAAGSAIHADEATNTLILQAPAADLRRLKEVIARLDVRRAQVLVEGIIAELSTDRADELGVQWQTQQDTNGWVGGALFPGTEAGGISGVAGEDGGINLAQGLSFGYLRGAGDIRVLLRALSNDRYTNVLSTPTLMTLDNAEAEIVVGQNVPFVTGQFTNQATTPENPFQTINRQDVGVVLRVKPQINYGDTVTLELEQEVSSVDSSTSGADLITNKRSIKTTVLVDDQDIVVLGGLIENSLRENEQKIPLLGDIPLLGQLFKNSRSDYTKTNLMVFLRPSIMRDPIASRDAARVRYDALREKQEAAEPQRNGLLRREAPRLPAFDGLYE
ncbi:MAG: type II secretion system secretin GspD [Gammaproteobacteria bacterium]